MSYVSPLTPPRFMAGRQLPEQVRVEPGPVYGFLRQLQGARKIVAMPDAVALDVLDVMDGNLLPKKPCKKSWLA